MNSGIDQKKLRPNRATERNGDRQMGPLGHREFTSGVGALVLGGDYRALGMARSLGRQRVPVWVVMDEHRLAGMSRYVRRRFRWPSSDECRRVEFLLDLCQRNHLNGWVIFPSSDQAAALLARHQRVLSEHYCLSTPPWEVLRWFDDKRLTYQLAADLDIAHPRTYAPRSREDLANLAVSYPSILKPAVKTHNNQFTHDKAWRVDDANALVSRYDEACHYAEPGQILVQELLPGGSRDQFSYAALYQHGRPLAALSARRTRQYPIDFGWSSSFVETVNLPEIVASSQRLLGAINFSGLVEVEFKRDPRDHRYKLLDVNPRIWGWHTLGHRAGIDFTYLLWRLIRGETMPELQSRSGVRWVRGAMDVPAVIAELRTGRLSVKQYLRSLSPPIEFAIIAVDDPLPSMLELPLIATLAWQRSRRKDG